MKHCIFILIVGFILCIRGLATEYQTVEPSPQELARQVIKAFQSAHASEIKLKLASDTLILEKGAKTYPDSSVIHFALAICYISQGDKIAALKTIEKAYTLSNQDPGVGIMYSFALKINKQPLKAYLLNKEMVKLHPETPQLHLLLATIEITIQKYDEATKILEALLRKAPADVTAQDRSTLLYSAGICYLFAGKHEKAIETLENALASTPKMGSAFALMGEAHLKLGHLENASAYLDKALAINPAYPKALYYKGLCFEKTGHPEKARMIFEEAFTSGKNYLGDNGEDYYLMYLVSQKVSKQEEGDNYRKQAAQLMFLNEAPWKQ